MKRAFYLGLVASIAIFSMTSCNKETLPNPPGAVSGSGSNNAASNNINLIANHWEKDATGFYVCTFKNIIPAGSQAKIYLVTGGDERQINKFIFFMGGELWATGTGSDIKITYRSNSKPTFELNIKVVVE